MGTCSQGFAVLLGLGIFFISNVADAKPRISVVGAASFYSMAAEITAVPAGDLEITGETDFGFPGGGILFGFSSAPEIEIEAGILYLTQKHALQLNSVLAHTDAAYLYKTHSILIPLMVIFHPENWMSIGVGGYGTLPVKDEVEQTPSGQVGGSSVNGPTTTVTYSQAGFIRNDLGLMVAAGVLLPLSSHWSVRVEARYAFGLRELSTQPQTASFKSHDLIALTGLAFGF